MNLSTHAHRFVGLVPLLVSSSYLHANQPPDVANVTALQRQDASKLVDIYYDLSDPDGDICTITVEASADGGLTWNLPIDSIGGDVGYGVAHGTQKHIIWDPSADIPGLFGTSFAVRVCATDNPTVPPGAIVAWGRNNHGQLNVPDPNDGYVDISAGDSHVVGMTTEGSLVAWGNDANGQCQIPAPNEGFVAIDAGDSHNLGLKTSTAIIAWGWNNYGQCDVPLPNSSFEAVEAGVYHSLALRSNRTIEVWGSNDDGQCDLPNPNADFVAISAGMYHSLALRTDGSIVAWGRNVYGQCNVPDPNSDFIALAGGGGHSLAIRSDGSIVAWGRNDAGECDVPLPNSNFIDVAAGSRHSMGLKADGTVIVWGNNEYGQCNVPAPNADFVDIAAGHYFSLGLRQSGGRAEERYVNCSESDPFAIVESGPGTLLGSVRSYATGDPLDGATISVQGHDPLQSGPDGTFALAGLDAGETAFSISKDGYYGYSGSVMIREDSATQTQVLMTPLGDFGVAAVQSQFCGPGTHAYFLDGVSLEQTFTATIEWDSHAPYEVRFITPRGIYYGDGSGDTWSCTLDMGEDFGSEGTLHVQAVADGGALESPLHEVNMQVIDPPTGLPAIFLQRNPFTDDLQYGGTLDLSIIDDVGVGDDEIPDDTPGFGGKAFKFATACKLTSEVTGDSARAGVEVPAAPKWAKIGKTEFMPDVGGYVVWQYGADSGWQAGGQFDISVAELKAESTTYTIILVGPIPVPVYWQMGVGLDLEASLILQGWADDDEPLLNGVVTVEPSAEVALGVGVADVLAAEGYLGGGAIMIIQYPEQPTLEELKLYLSGGVRIVIFIWEYDVPLLEYTWDVYGGKWILTQHSKANLRAIPRDYLVGPETYAMFTANSGRESWRDSVTVETELQSNVFGQSEPVLAALGDDLLLVWIYDDPDRTPTNRTELVYSRYDSTSDLWSTPIAVADDGTADFHPQLTVLPNGDVLLAWENVREILDEPDDPNDPDQLEAKLEELKSKTEVAVARYDAATGQWSAAEQLTDNLHLDRSPRISGASDGTAMLTWMSNLDNDPTGGPTAPSDLYAARYDGSAWAEAIAIDTVAHPIIKSAMAYRVDEALLLFATDTDDSMETVVDREIYGASYDGAGWSQAIELTDDTGAEVEDAQPQLAYDSSGGLLATWYRGGDVVSASLPDLSDREVVLNHEESSGLSDFSLAVGQMGQIGLIWQETSEERVDCWYATYDPVVSTWSAAQQLTADGSLEYAMSPVFDASGDLLAAYDKAQIEYETREVDVNGEIVIVDNVPVPGQVDLYLLRHTVSGDLAVTDADLSIHPKNPIADGEATIEATVHSLGDVPAVDLVVAFYDGDPGAGGLLIDEVTLPEVLVGGESAVASIVWQVPQSSMPHQIYAVVDPDQLQEDRDRANNTASLADVMLPDLTVSMLSVQSACDDRLLSARVLNAGSLPVMDVPVVLRQDDPDNGPTLATFTIEELVPGAYEDVVFHWADPPDSPTGSWYLYAVADELDNFLEFDEENNVRSVRVAVGQEPCAGDLDGDGDTDQADLGVLLAAYNQTAGGDLDGDGDTDQADLGILLSDYGCGV